MKKNGKIVKCDECKKEIYVPKYKLEHNKHFFCNQSCRYKYRIGKKRNPWSEEVKQKISNALKGTKLSEETKQKISQANKGKTSYIRTEKTIKKQKETIKKNGGHKGEKNPMWKGGISRTIDFCDNCGKEHNFKTVNYKNSKNHFCSIKCRSEYQSKYIVGKANPNFKSMEIECDNCGKIIYVCPSQNKRNKYNFCSRFCDNEHRKKSKRYALENNPQWLGGLSFFPYPLKWSNQLRESIRQRDGYTCRICGYVWDKKDRKLSVHHIDYNKNNLNPENLISLCTPCHSKTHHKRDYWINYFNEVLI